MMVAGFTVMNSRRSVMLGAFAALLGAATSSSSPAVDFEFSPTSLVVGKPTIVEMRITAPAGGIAPGGAVFFPFYLKPWTGLERGLSADKTTNRLVRAERGDGGSAKIRNTNRNPEFDILSDLVIEITGSPLAAGQSLAVTFGTNEQKVTPRRKQRLLVVEAKLDRHGDGGFETLQPKRLRVDAGEPESLHLVAPSYVKPGELFQVAAWLEDAADNLCETVTVPLAISWVTMTGAEGALPSYTIRALDQTQELDRNQFAVNLARPGVYYLRARARVNGAEFEAVSNPVVVTEDVNRRLYWGDIHIHTQASDGRGELADVYRDGYGKGLDFISITDHGFGRDARGSVAERLEAVCRHAERYHRPGRYLAIAGGETHYLPKNHVNLYFREAGVQRMKSVLDRLAAAKIKQKLGQWTDADVRAAGRTYWEAIRQPGYERFPLAIPHHTMWQGVEGFLDGKRGRLFEIFSVHGSSETRDQADIPKPLRMKEWRMEAYSETKYSAREALARGHRLGFAGGSDTHEGQPGHDALTGVWLPELTRDAIFEALYNRQCYATSANRTIIEIERDGRAVSGRVMADGELDRVELIAGGEVAHTVELTGPRVAEISWTAPAGTDYCYVRVLLREAEAAWSSPVWFD